MNSKATSEPPLSTQGELSRQLADLTSCEQEPLQHIGSIQSHGCFLAFTLDDHRIQMASENVADFFGRAHRDILGAKLHHVLEFDFAAQIVEVCASWSEEGLFGLNISHPGSLLDGFLFHSDGLFCLELERSPANSENDHRPKTNTEKILRQALISLKESRTLDQLGSVVCRSIRELTQLDRVMLYRFMPPTWYGQVIAEDRVVSSHSFMQHRFPASDIPRIARDLYLRNGLRMIADIDSPIFPISPAQNPLTQKPLDLADSKLRAVSPIHLEYLRNMRIQASISVAIVVQNELWGLIACHHLSPYRLRRDARVACELIADAFAAQAPLIESLDDQRLELEFNDKIHRITEELSVSSHPVRELINDHLRLLDAFNCAGVAMLNRDKIDMAGLTPTQAQIIKLSLPLRERLRQDTRRVVAIQNLTELSPEFELLAGIASGVLAFELPEGDEAIFMLFRPELLETITWGGDPRKQLVKKGFTGRINPRSSFEAWHETIRGRSAPWRRFEIEGLVHLSKVVFRGFQAQTSLLQDLQQTLEGMRAKDSRPQKY